MTTTTFAHGRHRATEWLDDRATERRRAPSWRPGPVVRTREGLRDAHRLGVLDRVDRPDDPDPIMEGVHRCTPEAAGLRFGARSVSGCFPTNDGSYLIFVQWPVSAKAAVRRDPLRQYLERLRTVPRLAEYLQGAQLQTRLLGALELPTYFRTAHGPGWAWPATRATIRIPSSRGG